MSTSDTKNVSFVVSFVSLYDKPQLCTSIPDNGHEFIMF